MGILDTIENIVEGTAGATVANTLLHAVDPDAGVIMQTIASVIGANGVQEVKQLVENHE